MHRKRIALMYISEVSGHHSATIAVEKALKILQPDINVLNINAFRYTNPISEKIVNQIYTTVIKRTPKLWDMIYDNPKVKDKLDRIKKTIHKLNSPKFQRLFSQFHPDVVICSQAFPCGMVADYKKAYNSSIPLIAVLTDFAPHSYWIYNEVDAYIVPSEEVGARLAQKGVPSYKIKPLGIPFNPKFNAPVENLMAYNKLGLDPFLPTILIMGGGQGLGPIKTIVKSMNKINPEYQTIIVTGTNKKLYNSLLKKTQKMHNKFVILKYVDYINELMSISNMIITKPGGITTSEALAKKLPMLIIKPIPGQEENNTIYLTEKKAAIRITKPQEIHKTIEDLLNHPAKLKAMSEAAAGMAKPDAAMDIAKLALRLSNA